MRVTVRLGRAFAKDAGFSERALSLDAGATAANLLEAVAAAAPGLPCITQGTVDLAVAVLSLNGKTVDARHPERQPIAEGDFAYLHSPISGG